MERVIDREGERYKKLSVSPKFCMYETGKSKMYTVYHTPRRLVISHSFRLHPFYLLFFVFNEQIKKRKQGRNNGKSGKLSAYRTMICWNVCRYRPKPIKFMDFHVFNVLPCRVQVPQKIHKCKKTWVFPCSTQRSILNSIYFDLGPQKVPDAC